MVDTTVSNVCALSFPFILVAHKTAIFTQQGPFFILHAQTDTHTFSLFLAYMQKHTHIHPPKWRESWQQNGNNFIIFLCSQCVVVYLFVYLILTLTSPTLLIPFPWKMPAFVCIVQCAKLPYCSIQSVHRKFSGWFEAMIRIAKSMYRAHSINIIARYHSIYTIEFNCVFVN